MDGLTLDQVKAICASILGVLASVKAGMRWESEI